MSLTELTLRSLNARITPIRRYLQPSKPILWCKSPAGGLSLGAPEDGRQARADSVVIEGVGRICGSSIVLDLCNSRMDRDYSIITLHPRIVVTCLLPSLVCTFHKSIYCIKTTVREHVNYLHHNYLLRKYKKIVQNDFHAWIFIISELNFI